MPYAEECDRPWYVEPSVLLKLNFAPSMACFSNAINSLTRGIILITALCLGASVAYGPTVFLFGLVLLAVLYGPSLYATLIGGGIDIPQKEGFQADLVREAQQPQNQKPEQVEVIGSNETSPSARNPFMNVLIDEIKYNPSRPPAQDINDPLVKAQLDDFFRIQWFSDPTDVFGRAQSQREFYTMPSTSIPNDQGSYQDWLYKIPGKTCKEGGRGACLPGTDGSPVPWLNADR